MKYEKQKEILSDVHLPVYDVKIVNGEFEINGVKFKINWDLLAPEEDFAGHLSYQTLALAENQICAVVEFEYTDEYEDATLEEQKALCDKSEQCNWLCGNVVSIYHEENKPTTFLNYPDLV